MAPVATQMPNKDMQTDDCEEDRGGGRYLDSRDIRDARDRHASPCQVELTAARQFSGRARLDGKISVDSQRKSRRHPLSFTAQRRLPPHRKMDDLIQAGRVGILRDLDWLWEGPRSMALMYQGYAVPRSA